MPNWEGGAHKGIYEGPWETDSFANFYFYSAHGLDRTILSLIEVFKYQLCPILEGCPCINAIMGRPTWGKLPLDPRKHQEHINKILQSSESVHIQQIVGSSTQARDLQLRAQTAMADIKLSSWISKFAVAIQKYGLMANVLCEACQRGEGPFQQCIRMPGKQHDRCGNCIYLRKACSSASGTRC